MGVAFASFLSPYHMQKQAPHTKEITKLDSHANNMLGPQVIMLSPANIVQGFVFWGGGGHGQSGLEGLCLDEIARWLTDWPDEERRKSEITEGVSIEQCGGG